jgi:hypothetical protein
MRFRHLSGVAALAALTMIFCAAGANASQLLASHRAVYDIELETAADSTGITGLSGRMVYEFGGSACDGYTVNFRYVTRVDTSEDSRLTDQQSTTFENGDGSLFTFASKSFVNDSLDKEVRGTARIKNGKASVELKKPDEQRIVLGSTMFPTHHMLDMIERAKKGQSFYEANLFDGSDDADRAMITTVIIGKKTKAENGDGDISAMGSFKDEPFWPVSMAYFDPQDDQGGEETPTYRINFKLYENGITRDLVMDYGDFSMRGHLVNLSLEDPAAKCSQ